jgi:lysophospholipase L1-like esterase
MYRTIVKLSKLCFFCALLVIGFGQIPAMSQINSFSVDTFHNRIQNTQNDKGWLRFAIQVQKDKLNKKGNVTIVHIGDSHIQGGYFTNRVRELLSKKYGIRERGFVFPYSLLKANSPDDVQFYSTTGWSGQKYNYNPSKEKTGIAGYHLVLTDNATTLSVSLKQGSGLLYPFRELEVYHDNPQLQVSVNAGIRVFTDSIGPALFVSRMMFNKPMDSIQFQIYNNKPGTQFFGINLKNNRPGINYHSIGINGIGIEMFTKYIDYIPMLKVLNPDCIIISLGTNDAFARKVDTLLLKQRLLSMIFNIKKEFPNSCILLTTPGDHMLNEKYKNANLLKVQSVIISVALNQNLVFWDFFNEMGGLGSSERWFRNGLMFKDMLHLSKEGYRLQGDLFFEAFDNAIEAAKIQ